MTLKKHLKTCLYLGSIALLTSCGHIHIHDDHVVETYDNQRYGHKKTETFNMNHAKQNHRQNEFAGFQTPKSAYNPVHSHKLISSYTEKMAMDLVRKLKYVTDKTPVAVTSFVEFDRNLKTSSVLGNQLAESFITEMQEFGMSIVDFKHTGKIVVSKNGDFSFSRNGDDLSSYPNIQYVLTGTLTYDETGVIVNARIIGVKSKIVVSAAKGYIPYFVLRSSTPSIYLDGIPSSYYQ